MLTPVPLTELAEDLVPQAIIDRPTSYFAKQFQITFTREHDDLDEYKVAALRIGSQGFVFALKHYQGYPENTTTIYLPASVTSISTISYVIAAITDELRIPRSWIVWQRIDDPEL
jgi:hypothetical protein